VGPFVKGDVVIIPFPFDDFSQAKRRPAIVVAAPPGLSLVVAQITGQIYRDAYAIPITAGDFVSGSIHKDSYIRANFLFTVHPNASCNTPAR
jgi:mRNA interferase MazF